MPVRKTYNDAPTISTPRADDPSRMVNDQNTAATPVLKSWLVGQKIELPRKQLYID